MSATLNSDIFGSDGTSVVNTEGLGELKSVGGIVGNFELNKLGWIEGETVGGIDGSEDGRGVECTEGTLEVTRLGEEEGITVTLTLGLEVG